MAKRCNIIIIMLILLLVVTVTKGQGEHALARGKNTLGVLGLISFTYPGI